MSDENGKAATAPTADGITGEVVRPPWWDDPAEQGREQVRLLHIIAQELAVLNRRITALEQRIPTGLNIGAMLRPRR